MKISNKNRYLVNKALLAIGLIGIGTIEHQVTDISNNFYKRPNFWK